MSVTVRLIFWGLIGFVPNPGGHDGLTALLVDPKHAQPLETKPECAVPPHFSVVYLLEGQCEGACERIPDHQLGNALLMGFRQPLQNGEPLPLFWLLEQEDLTITGGDDDRMKFRSPFFFLRFLQKRSAPRSERQASYFTWVQSMDTLTGGHGEVKPACLNPGITRQDGDNLEQLKEEERCPIHARLKVRSGRASACHLLHLLPPSDAGDGQRADDGKRDVQIFDYTVPGQPNPLHKATADAMLVQLKAEGDNVVLLSQGFPERHDPSLSETPPNDPPLPMAWARLRPDSHGKLTLVVANFPPRTGAAEDAHDHTKCAPSHSDILFRLLATQPKLPATRSASTETQKTMPGSCEPEAVELAHILSSASHGEFPHAATACDPRGFH